MIKNAHELKDVRNKLKMHKAVKTNLECLFKECSIVLVASKLLFASFVAAVCQDSHLSTTAVQAAAES